MPPPTAASRSGPVVVFLQTAVGASAIAFGGLSWALDGAAAPVAAARRLEAAMEPVGALTDGTRVATDLPRRPRVQGRDVRLRDQLAPRARRLRPHDPGRNVDGDRRSERRGEDDAGQIAVPPVRPAVGSDRGRRCRPARDRAERMAVRVSRPVSRTSFVSSSRCARTSRRRGASDDDIEAALRDAAGHDLADLDTSSPAGTKAAPSSRAASGSGSRWRACCARCASVPESCCSTSHRTARRAR